MKKAQETGTIKTVLIEAVLLPNGEVINGKHHALAKDFEGHVFENPLDVTERTIEEAALRLYAPSEVAVDQEVHDRYLQLFRVSNTYQDDIDKVKKILAVFGL